MEQNAQETENTRKTRHPVSEFHAKRVTQNYQQLKSSTLMRFLLQLPSKWQPKQGYPRQNRHIAAAARRCSLTSTHCVTPKHKQKTLLPKHGETVLLETSCNPRIKWVHRELWPNDAGRFHGSCCSGPQNHRRDNEPQATELEPPMIGRAPPAIRVLCGTDMIWGAPAQVSWVSDTRISLPNACRLRRNIHNSKMSQMSTFTTVGIR